jgi:hypothetical protein
MAHGAGDRQANASEAMLLATRLEALKDRRRHADEFTNARSKVDS